MANGLYGFVTKRTINEVLAILLSATTFGYSLTCESFLNYRRLGRAPKTELRMVAARL